MKSKRIWSAGCVAAAAVALTLSLTGCDGFFVRTNTNGSTSTTGTTGSYAYVSNVNGLSQSLSIYALASGTPIATSTSPFSIGFQPTALAVTPSNSFLYAANAATGVLTITAYAIASGGGLGTGAAVAATVAAVAMDISPDGQWLFALDAGGSVLYEYKINSSTGALTLMQSLQYAGTGGTLVAPSAVKVAPTGQFVVAALGTGGDIVIPFNTSTGALSTAYQQISAGGLGDFSVTLDKNNYLYVSRTTGIAVYALAANGAATAATGTNACAAGNAPRQLVFSQSYGFLYVANSGSNTITGCTVGSNGALTSLPGSPFNAVGQVSALAVDNSGSYLLAGGLSATTSNAGLEVFSIGSTGALGVNSNAIVTSGTTPPTLIAVTH